jgi:O-antigen ligase
VGYDSGLTKNPNDLALMLNLMLPFGLALLGSTRRGWLRLLLLAAVVLNVTAVIVTFSRAGFLTLGCTFSFYLVRLMSRGRWVLAAGALGLALAATAFLPSGYLLRLATITEIDADVTGSAQIRSNDSLAALRIVASRPLVGAGAGMNILALNDARGSSWLHVHNVYLEFGTDLGIPGLVLFLMLLGASLKDARLVRRRTAERADAAVLFQVAQAAEAGLLAFAVAAFFHPVAYDVYFYLVAGLAVAARTVHELEAAGQRA